MAILINENRFEKLVVLLVPLGVLYNCFLAFVNGNVFGINTAIIVTTEVLLLGSLFALIVITGFQKHDRWPIALLAVYFLTALITTLINGFIFVDAIRNVLIVSVMTMIGMRVSEDKVHFIFLIISVVVFGVLVLETLSLESYVKIFQPNQYFVGAKGGKANEFNELGLFSNALGFESRFSYGVFKGPRTSSVFLEQVSLANFSMVLAIYVMSFWDKLTKHKRILYVVCVALILLSNESRTGGAIVLLCLVGYFIFPKLPKYGNAFIVPLIILLTFTIIQISQGGYGDNLLGRLSLGMNTFFDLSYKDYFGWGIRSLNHFWDSGFAYIVASGTIFGAIAFYAYINFLIPQVSSLTQRFVYGSNLYLVLNMLIGGNAIYSIKTATLLWLMAGFIYRTEYLDKTSSSKVHLYPEAVA